MQNYTEAIYYFLELSSYLMIVGVLFFVFDDFYVFRCRTAGDKRACFFRQVFWLFFVQGTGFARLALWTHNWDYVWFYGFVQIFLAVTLILVSLIYRSFHRQLLVNLCFLTGLGLLVIARLGLPKARRQYMILLISLTVSLLIPYLFQRVRFWKKLTWWYAGVGIGLLLAVYILGSVTNGSKISFTIAGVTFQPSEFVKILFLFFLAGALWKDISWKRVLLTAALAGIHVVILVLSRDLGSALIFFVAFVLVLFIATGSYLYLLAGVLGGAGASAAAYALFSHVRVRVLAWRDPWSYIDDQGYQITQSLFAVGSGNWFGMGLGEGTPASIPFVDADFIFSAICEELGVLFGICVILICLSSFLTAMQLSAQIPDRFYQMLVYGIGVTYLFQIFLTIGGGIKFIPLTGVTLPFVSYGGSSCMTSMFMFFILQGISIRLRQEGGGVHGAKAGNHGAKTERKAEKAAEEAPDAPGQPS